MNDNIKIKIQQAWALVAGAASLFVGIMSLVPGSALKLPTFDVAVHLITGIIFVGGAWKYVSKTNLFMGIVYILFGAFEFNIPHLIVGVVSLVLSLTMTPKKQSVSEKGS